MAVDARFEKALHACDRVGALRGLAQSMLTEGSDLAAVRGQFERVRQDLRTANREADEDAIMDVMDFLDGWCSPHMRLGNAETETG